jgi:hypothetical protein
MAGMRRNRQAFLMLTIATATACGGGSDAIGPDAGGACTGNVTVSVSAGTTPTFTWTPACRVIGLLVELEASDQWFIEGTGGGIASGVQYGIVPPGATSSEPARPLVSGTTYEVILFRGTSETATIAAIKEFRP